MSFTDLDGFEEGPLTSAATAQVAVPGVTPSASSLTIIEGGNADYTVVLDTEPTAGVTIEIGGHSGTDVTLSGSTLSAGNALTFTTVNWSTPQTVTVSAAEDGDAAHDTVTLTHTVAAGSAPEYLSLPAVDVAVTVNDNDVPGVTISRQALEIDEGTNDTYTVRLNTEPSADVTISVSGHAGTDVSVSPTSLTFTTTDWSATQTVTVSAGQDDDALNDEVTLMHAVSGTGGYATVTAVDVKVTIDDDEEAKVVLSKTTLTVGEEGSGSYTVKLSAKPTAGVTVNITGHSGTDVSVSPSNISFTTTNWNTARTVQVSAADDHDSTNDSVTLVHTVAAGSAQEFTGAAAVNVTVNVTDNDTPGAAISKSALEIDEGGTDRYTVRLNTQPPADVTITVGGHSGTGVSPSPASLTFTRTNWSTPQTVTVSAAQDDDAMDATVTLTHAVSGTGDYASVTAADVEVTVDDDDTPGVVVSPSPLRVDEGGSASYKVRLATLPTAGVTVTISGHGGTVLSSVSPTTLTFTRSNWKTERTVTSARRRTTTRPTRR